MIMYGNLHRSLPLFFTYLFGLFVSASAQSPEGKVDEKNMQPQVRYICVCALAED